MVRKTENQVISGTERRFLQNSTNSTPVAASWSGAKERGCTSPALGVKWGITIDSENLFKAIRRKL